MVAAKRGFRNLLQVFSFLKHVLNRRLINHKVRLTVLAIDLDAIAVIPLDDSVDLLVIAQNDYHWSPRLHLLLIIEIFGVGLLWRGQLLSALCAHGTLIAIAAFGTLMPFGTLTPFLHRHRSGVVISVIL